MISINKKIIAVFLTLVLLCSTIVFSNDFGLYQSRISELEMLLAQCEALGFECQYERLNKAVIERFLYYAMEDASNGVSSQPTYTFGCLDELYIQTKSSLESIIAGDKTPLVSPKYLTSPIRAQGRSLIANTTEGERPVFFTGYGHFSAAMEDIPNFNTFGANIIQQEIGVWNMICDSSIPINWNIHKSGSVDASFTMERNPQNVRNGNASIKIINNTPRTANTYIYMAQSIEVKPNTVYEYGLSYKGNTNSGVYFSPDNSVKRNLSSSSFWRNEKYEYITGPQQTGMYFVVLCEDITEMYIDSIFFREKSTGTEIINNGSFEIGGIAYGEFGEYSIDTTYFDNTIAPMLSNAAENNIAVSLLISPHYYPQFILDKYQLALPGGVNDIYNWKYKEALDIYIEVLMNLLEPYTQSLHDICISNEPMYNAMNNPNVLPDYRNYLRNKYSTISNLNSAYKTQYSSFDNIVMPSAVSETLYFYDWMNFNNMMFSQWHQWIAEKVKQVMPDAKINSKVQDYFAKDGSIQFERNRLTWGTEAEEFADFSDLMGNDSHSSYEWSARPIQGKMKWYDYLSSLGNKPVFNSEDHIITDKYSVYNTQLAKFVSADIFQGAIHGRTSTVIWVWERSLDTNNMFNGSVLQRPDCVASIGKAGLDLNRLAYEITALESTDTKVGMLYSNCARVYNKYYISLMHSTYEACLYAGQKVEFVTEKSSRDMSKYNLVIIPYVTNIDKATLYNIKRYIQQGGRVLIVGNDSLRKDEKNNPHSDYIDYIFENSAVLSGYVNSSGNLIFSDNNTIRDGIITQLKQLGKYDVEVYDKTTGMPLSNVEWRSVSHEGKILINLCNYTWSNISNLGVKVNGEEQVQYTDIISGTDYYNSFSLTPFTPMILSIDNNVLEAGFDVQKFNITEKNNEIHVEVKVKNMSAKASWANIEVILVDSLSMKTVSRAKNKVKIKSSSTDGFYCVFKKSDNYQINLIVNEKLIDSIQS